MAAGDLHLVNGPATQGVTPMHPACLFRPAVVEA